MKFAGYESVRFEHIWIRSGRDTGSISHFPTRRFIVLNRINLMYRILIWVGCVIPL